MSPQEKAEQLCRSYWHYFTAEPSVNSVFKHAKQCALFAVDEILNALGKADTAYDLLPTIEYYQQVKTEIDKL